MSVSSCIFCALFLIFVLFYAFLCCSMYFCVALCIVCFVSFSVLFVCIYVLYYCHRVATQLQLNISYHLVSGEIFITTFSKPFPQYVVFTNLALITV